MYIYPFTKVGPSHNLVKNKYINMTPSELNRQSKDAKLNKAQVWRASRDGVAHRIGGDGKPTGETNKVNG